jgi:nucleotide-binding universal stress UspA family protein
MSGIRRIVLASDFSTASRPALRKALELARSIRARLLIVHALSPIVPPMMGEGVYVSPKMWNEIEAGARKAAQKQLARLLQTARKSGVRAAGLVVEGSPSADRIVRAARARRADLLVVGTHGRTGLSRLVLGSVAALVVATAPCPVLTVRARR